MSGRSLRLFYAIAVIPLHYLRSRFGFKLCWEVQARRQGLGYAAKVRDQSRSRAHDDRRTWSCLCPRVARTEPADGLAVASLSAVRPKRDVATRDVPATAVDVCRATA